MSTRSAQCQECTVVFDVEGRGRLPSRCPKCRKDAGDRPASPPAARKKVKASTNGHGSLADALNALRADLEATQERAALLEEAIASMEKLVA